MAIVEDEVRNESEDDNDIEVVVEEDDGDQDSDDSDVDDDDEVLETKVAELERRISEDPYHYEDHIDLIQALWGLSELERWREAFNRLQQLSALRAEHWLLRLQTEVTLAHSEESREQISTLFHQAALDCYSIPIYSEWCSWALSGSAAEARAALDEVLRRAGPDPLSGKFFWDAKLELEKSQLDTMSAEDPEYVAQQERVLWCAEEALARPLMRGAAAAAGGSAAVSAAAPDAWPPLRELAAKLRDHAYIDKVEKQHEVAMDYLKKITPFEDKLLTLENVEEKCATYQEYIDTVKELSRDDKYSECDNDGILKVLYDRATTECMSCGGARAAVTAWVAAWARLVQRRSSRATLTRVLAAAARRLPRHHLAWTLTMRHLEDDRQPFDKVKETFETALSKGMESYKEAESLWLSYLEFTRRQTDFESESDKERLRRTFRLAWDSLAESWGEQANDCEVPLYWARLEYTRLRDPKQGKDIFEEVFKYGENKTMSKYWEALINLEWGRQPRPSEHKTRELFRRALRFVTDYPPAIARLWTDYERDYGQLHSLEECSEACEAKLKEWKDNYQAMKEKMTGQKHKGKSSSKQPSKKTKFDKKKKKEDEPVKGKRKSDGADEKTEVKRKKDGDNVERDKGSDSGGGVKRSHDEEEVGEGVESKRVRTNSSLRSVGEGTPAARDACTLFVSNLEFKVEEPKLRAELSKYGEIMSLRLRAGVKAFGGSICYCQYSKPESVDEALKHDRTPLDGRPMFFSRYSAKKSKQPFKYGTEVEKNKLFVKNLPYSRCNDESLREIFNKNGKVKDVRVVTFKDGKPKGIAYIEYSDEAAAAEALEQTNGTEVDGRTLDVAISAPPPRKDASETVLGQPKREQSGGMRRTQLSQFIPSVLQRPSTSAGAANGSHTNGDKRPLSNADFRSLLLK